MCSRMTSGQIVCIGDETKHLASWSQEHPSPNTHPVHTLNSSKGLLKCTLSKSHGRVGDDMRTMVYAVLTSTRVSQAFPLHAPPGVLSAITTDTDIRESAPHFLILIHRHPGPSEVMLCVCEEEEPLCYTLAYFLEDKNN